MSRLLANRCLPAALALLLAAACWGCGAGEYKKRLDDRVREIGQETPLSRMHAAMEIPGTPVMIRIPKFFEEVPPDARRAKWPLDLADLKLTYEGFVADSDEGKVAYYCYLAVTEMSHAGARDPNRALRNRLMDLFPGTAVQWEDIHCKTPDGRATKWQKSQTAGELEFYYDKDGKAEPRRMQGTIEVYSRKEGDFTVIIVWRVPSHLKDHVGLQEWAPRMAGTVTVKAGN